MLMNDTMTDTVPASPRFKGEVLNKIYRVWLFRKLLPVLLLEIAVVALVLYELAKVVFFQRVAENAMKSFFSHPAGIFSFFVSAFTHASGVTKMLIFVIAVALAFFVRHITQGFLRLILVRENYFSRIQKGEKGSL